MRYLIIGGSKSGKSDIAEKLALNLNRKRVIYIATMKPYDDEDRERIKNHISKRQGYNFDTIEVQKDIANVIKYVGPNDTILLDSITSLLTNEMFFDGRIEKDAFIKIISGLKALIKKVKNVLIVSDFIFNDSIEYDEITKNYMKQLGIINREIAKECDNVIECSFGNAVYRKGSLI